MGTFFLYKNLNHISTTNPVLSEYPMNLVHIRFGNTLSSQIYRARQAQREFQKRRAARPCDVQIATRSKNPAADLKARYWPNTLYASLLSTALLFAIAWFYPEYHPTIRTAHAPMRVVRPNIPETIQKKRPPSPPRPQVPLAVEGEEVPEDITIESTELDLDNIALPTLAGVPSADYLDEPIDYFEIDYKPHPNRIVVPEYPPEARGKGFEGKVTVKVLVDKEGNVEDVQFVHGPEILKEAALAAARQFRFRPGKHKGERRKVWMFMPIDFSLK